MKKDRGFALILLLSILPALLAAFAALVLILGVVRTRASLRNTCRRTLLVGLENAGRDMKDLVELNPQAQALRTAIGATKIELAAAVATLQFELVSALKAELQTLQSEQNLLDIRQRGLFLSASAIIARSQAEALRGVHSGGNPIVRAIPLSFIPVRPALHPAGSGPAPDYVLDEPFPKSQRLAQKWQTRFSLPAPFGKFLNVRGVLEETCAATLETSAAAWRARLDEDKF